MKRVALITGGTRGIGFGIARHLAGEDFDLVLCGRRAADEVDAGLQPLRDLGARVHYTPCDVADPGARARLMEFTRATAGRLHVLVNNAGVAPPQRRPLLEAEESDFEWVLKTNLQGPYFLTQAAARWMLEQKENEAGWRGAIINITSVSATVVSVNRGEYCVAKAGLSMATQCWAAQLGACDLPVYEVRPGVTATDMTAGVKEKYDRLIAEGLCVQPRWGTPDDVGRAVAMLARGDLPYSTGQVIHVDGGLAMRRL